MALSACLPDGFLVVSTAWGSGLAADDVVVHLALFALPRPVPAGKSSPDHAERVASPSSWSCGAGHTPRGAGPARAAEASQPAVGRSRRREADSPRSRAHALAELQAALRRVAPWSRTAGSPRRRFTQPLEWIWPVLGVCLLGAVGAMSPTAAATLLTVRDETPLKRCRSVRGFHLRATASRRWCFRTGPPRPDGHLRAAAGPPTARLRDLASARRLGGAHCPVEVRCGGRPSAARRDPTPPPT